MITVKGNVRIPHAAEIAIHKCFSFHSPEVLHALEWDESDRAFTGVYRGLYIKVTREGALSVKRLILE